MLLKIYTINLNKSASSNNYKSIDAAVDDLVNGSRSDSAIANGPGVSNHVTFLIADGIYKTRIFLEYIQGTSDTSRVHFKSASEDSSKVVITWPSDSLADSNFILKLSTTTYCTFSHLSFIRTGKRAFATLIDMYDTRHIMFTNCYFNSGAGSKNSYEAFAFTGGGHNYAVYNNLLIDSVYTGFNISSSSKNIIQKCTIKHFYYAGIILIENESSIIRNNNIIGIYEGDGIYTNKCNNLQVLGNKIILKNGGTGFSDNGSTINSTNMNLFANNMISIRGGQFAYGIFLNATSYIDIINNSVLFF
ncbi:MAG: hypothetical protein EOO43_20925 [Flavobacterium sp.]|nr:MAG: hypothetical protein EOO43_20925 [Flavobacterium sp.]